MGNFFQPKISNVAYFTKLGATIITQEENIITLLYNTLSYTFVSNNNHYMLSQKCGKVHTLHTLQECGARMKADVAALLATHHVNATVWDGEGGLREVRFDSTHMPQIARTFYETYLTESLTNFGKPVTQLSRIGQLLVHMDAASVERCKLSMRGKIHIKWMDVSNGGAAKN
jgi:hypothetical protein